MNDPLSVFQLRAARRSLGFTAKQVADVLDISVQTVFNAEKIVSFEDIMFPPKMLSNYTISRFKAFFEREGIFFESNNRLGYNYYIKEMNEESAKIAEFLKKKRD